MKSRLALLLSTAVTVSACVGGGPRSLDTMSGDAAQEISSLGGAMAVTITEIDLSGDLARALPGAVRASDAYRAARGREAEAMANIAAANSARRPQASVNLRGGELRESGARSDRFTGAYGSLTVSQLFSDGGGTRAAIDAATARALGARAERIAAGNEAALNAGRAWLELWQASARTALLAERSGSIDTLLGQIERMAENGMIDTATVDSARRQLVDINLERTQLRQSLSSAEAQFRRHFKALPEGSIGLTEVITADEARALAAATDTAPELRRAASDLIAARADLEARRATFRPRTSVQAGRNTPIDENDPDTTTFGLVVEYQIATGGRRVAEVEAAEARVSAAEAVLAERYEALGAEMAALVAQLDAAEAGLSLAQERVDLSAAEADTARSQLVTGQSSLRALIDAEIAHYRAADQLLTARAEKLGLQLAIAARAGELLIRLGLDE